jgi:predicted MFS family arabinose efflux permease
MSSEGAAPSPPRYLIPVLGIGQIVAWGSLYYAITVLGGAMADDLGIAKTTVFAAYSLGLFVSGLVAPLAGRWIDERSGSAVLAIGSVLGAIALAIIATAGNAAVFFVGWIAAGAAMAFSLYDPAFATINQVMPATFRRSVTALTLIGGFAGTVFWPLTQWLFDLYGWRATLYVYAGLHVAICWPLHRFLVPRPATQRAPRAATDAKPNAAKPPVRGFVWLATAFACTAFIASAVSAHVLTLLGAGGIGAGTAVWIMAIIGPMQVFGRIVEFTLAGNVRATKVGFVSFGLMVISLAIFAATRESVWIAVVFAIVYGWANGTMTIVRGTVPAELYGRDGYGALLGRLAQPQFIAKSIAPVALAFVIAEVSAGAAFGALVAAAAIALAAFGLAIRVR